MAAFIEFVNDDTVSCDEVIHVEIINPVHEAEKYAQKCKNIDHNTIWVFIGESRESCKSLEINLIMTFEQWYATDRVIMKAKIEQVIGEYVQQYRRKNIL